MNIRQSQHREDCHGTILVMQSPCSFVQISSKSAESQPSIHLRPRSTIGFSRRIRSVDKEINGADQGNRVSRIGFSRRIRSVDKEINGADQGNRVSYLSSCLVVGLGLRVNRGLKRAFSQQELWRTRQSCSSLDSHARH